MSPDETANTRAYQLATLAAEEFIRCNGTPMDIPDQYIFHGADIADDLFQEYIAHLKWVGQCVTFEIDSDDDLIVLLGDYTMESLA